MRLRSRGYERFSNYLLLRKLEADSWSELWRAAPVDGVRLGATVALRRFLAADPGPWAAAVDEANAISSFAQSSSIARSQRAGMIGNQPFYVHAYEGGRSLSTIAERAFGRQSTPLPLPVDLALAIVERVALSAANTHAVRREASPAIHGALAPSFVWITEEGEVRVAGQGLGLAVLTLPGALDPQGGLRPFIAPEVIAGGAPTPAADIFSTGAILLFLLSGALPPEAKDRARFSKAIGAARLVAQNQPLPAELARVLGRALTIDPEQRYRDSSELHQELVRLLHSGEYTATTFNLAYYFQSLLRADLEAEKRERQAESRINVATALAEERKPSPPPSQASPGTPAALREAAARRRFMPLVAGALLLLVAAVAGFAWYNGWPFVGRTTRVPVTARALPGQVSVPTQSSPAALSSEAPSVLPAPSAVPDDRGGRERAFEDEVNRRLREEMSKLQRQFDAQERARSAREQRQQPELGRVMPSPEAGAEVVPVPPAQAPDPSAAQPGPAQRPLAREGELFDLRDVDQAPSILRSTQPAYPPQAARQKLEASIVVTALISETGRVLDARILRGDARQVGFDEAALRAVRSWQFTPGTKDGQRIRAWIPVSVDFRYQQ
jgi:TonB family protein